MTPGLVSFIGAGPGDPELITRKGHRLIMEADLVLYAGSLVPPAVVACARPDATVLDSSSMTLEETHAVIRDHASRGLAVARVHTGDPSLYGAVQEQAALLEAEGIPYQVVPGVTAAFAAAAAARVSLTSPETVQAFSVARVRGRTPVPAGQGVRDLATHGGSLAVYLSAGDAAALQAELLEGGLAPDTPVLAAYRVGWPEERLVWTTVADLPSTIEEQGLHRQTVFLVLPDAGRGEAVSRLYDPGFAHGFRGAGR